MSIELTNQRVIDLNDSNKECANMKYQIGSIVIAKGDQYPPWPATIIKVLENYQIYELSFFGEKTFSLEKEQNLLDFNEKNIIQSQNKNKDTNGFKRAIQLAKIALEKKGKKNIGNKTIKRMKFNEDQSHNKSTIISVGDILELDSKEIIKNQCVMQKSYHDDPLCQSFSYSNSNSASKSNPASKSKSKSKISEENRRKLEEANKSTDLKIIEVINKAKEEAKKKKKLMSEISDKVKLERIEQNNMDIFLGEEEQIEKEKTKHLQKLRDEQKPKYKQNVQIMYEEQTTSESEENGHNKNNQNLRKTAKVTLSKINTEKHSKRCEQKKSPIQKTKKIHKQNKQRYKTNDKSFFIEPRPREIVIQEKEKIIQQKVKSMQQILSSKLEIYSENQVQCLFAVMRLLQYQHKGKNTSTIINDEQIGPVVIKYSIIKRLEQSLDVIKSCLFENNNILLFDLPQNEIEDHQHIPIKIKRNALRHGMIKCINNALLNIFQCLYK